jgi:hypothetical protein
MPLDLATVKLPSLAALSEAVQRRDTVELERLARRLGAARLVRAAATDTRPRLRQAALTALPLVDDAWTVLPELLGLCGARDSTLATAAVRAARGVAEHLTPEESYAQEVPPDVPRRAAEGLMALALRRDLAPAVRVEALRGAVSLRPLAPPDSRALESLLGDGEPQVRQTAAAALEPALVRALLDRNTASLGEPGEAGLLALEALVCEYGAGPLAPAARERLEQRAADTQVPRDIRDRLHRCLMPRAGGKGAATGRDARGTRRSASRR